MPRLIALLLALALAPGVATGQQQYRPPPDTVFVLLVNPYRMYWVRGTDTLSQPTHAVSVEAERWEQRKPGADLRVVVEHRDLDVHRRVKQDTFVVAPSGPVRTVNGHAPDMDERVDLLPRLPDRALRARLTWSDTLASSKTAAPGGRKTFSVIRAWRVDRLFDSAGTRMAAISAAGDLHYRDGWWTDSAASAFVTLDVRGPMTEHALLAITTGQLLERAWSMTLRGTGTISGEHGVDTVPAGLISAETQRTLSSAQAHLLARDLPGNDTSMSYSTGPILLHVVDRHPEEISAAMARNDGLVGTTHARFANGLLVGYQATWTDTLSTRETKLDRVHDSLVIHDSGASDTSVAIPVRWWAVADYAMNELLVPVFLSHPADGASDSFAVFRPFPRHWDIGVASLRPLGENLVASYRLGTDTAATYLLITRDGDLLMAENSGPTGAQRVPLPGTTRRAQLQTIMDAMQKGPRD
jgi:hypothetical protein